MIENINFNPPSDPWKLFQDWFTLAGNTEPNDPNAMSLATVGANGMPSVRLVLLKDFSSDGFTFFTNRESHKGEQLKEHPKASICFHWKSLRRQVRAEGLICEASARESDAYFATRPHGSQIGAWASQQSRVLKDRTTLEQRVVELEKYYEGKTVPRPPYWSGYRLVPLAIEFWQDRPYRLHDRIVYRRVHVQDNWTIERLYP